MNKIKPTGPSKEPVLKHISLHKFPYYKQESLHLKSDTLSSQKTKRTNAIAWKFSLTEIEDSRRFSQVLDKVTGSNKEVQELLLTFKRDFYITDKDLFYLARAFKELKSLQRLTLEAGDWSHVTDRGFYYLTKGLTRLRWLKSLSLEFSYSKITNVGLNYLSQSLKRLTLLEVIWLKGDKLKKVTDKGLKILNGSFNHLSKLEEMTLLFPYCRKMTDQSLERINFKRLVSLRSIYLSFAECGQLTDQGIYFLTQGLKKLPNLQEIGLELWRCSDLSDKSLHYIWELIKTLPCLEEIYIQFEACWEITDAGLDDINKTLTKDSIPLLDFELQFHNCREITDSGLVHLGQFLKKLVDIQRIHICFAGSDITDFGVKEVIDCMSSRDSLREVGLDFGECRNLTDTSLEKIREYLKDQSSLEKVTLCIDGLPETTASGIEGLIDDIENLERQRTGLQIALQN